MADGGGEKGKNNDFYQVLGLNKECSATELRSAYKKLALRWHPDRCSASGNSKFVEEAQQKFQAIQQAYSVLSDTNRRFLYDVGGMGDFLNEMAVMMSQTKPTENMEESFEELRELFDEMFQEDLNSFGMDSQAAPSCSPSHVSSSASSNSNNERVSVDMNLGKTEVDDSSSFNSHFEKFCLGVEQRQPFKKVKEAVRGGIQGGAGGRRRQDKNQKVSSGYNVSSHDYCISAS
uniref:J domain-containing protein n=1 Tax=Salix viminalis TaxID=40686 RepID=A0A6N2MX34_SALVM